MPGDDKATTGHDTPPSSDNSVLGMVANLRQRAAEAEAQARWMLGILTAVGTAGGLLLLSGSGAFDPVIKFFTTDTLTTQTSSQVEVVNAELEELKARFPITAGIAFSIDDKKLSDISEGIYDVAHHTASGKAIAVGKEATVIYRASSNDDFEEIRVPGLTAFLNDVEFSDQGDVYILGRSGTILHKKLEGLEQPENIVFDNLSIIGLQETLSEIRFSSTGDVFILSDKGKIFHRNVELGQEFFRKVYEEKEDIIFETMEFSPSGELVIVGKTGRILSLAPQVSPYDPGSFELISPPDLTANIDGLVFDNRGQLFVEGADGTILRRAKRGDNFEDMSVPGFSSHLRDISLGKDGDGNQEIAIVGDGGAILMLSKDRNQFEVVESPTKNDLYDVDFSDTGDLVAQGADGEIVFRPANTTKFYSLASGAYQDALFHTRFGNDNEALLVGERGSVLSFDPKKMAPFMGQTSYEDALRIVEIERGKIESKASPGFQLLETLETEIGQKLQELADAEADARAARTGDLDRDRRIGATQKFLENCLRATKSHAPYGMASDSANPDKAHLPSLVDACTRAFEIGMSGPKLQTTEVYRTILAQFAPGVLVLFLLATLGAAYRHYARIANFLNSRADALELSTMGDLRVDQFTKLVTAVKSEHTPFAETRTPVDTILDTAKEMAAKFNPKS